MTDHPTHREWNLALEALVNWCRNTEVHLREARRLKALKARLPAKVNGPIRQWVRQTQWLIARMQQELDRAEPDIVEQLGRFWPHLYSGQFLDQIPEAE